MLSGCFNPLHRLIDSAEESVRRVGAAFAIPAKCGSVLARGQRVHDDDPIGHFSSLRLLASTSTKEYLRPFRPEPR
ncbi:MAG TPA: hypothetical protein VGG61_01465, partial [Gemmataceae bacterium]